MTTATHPGRIDRGDRDRRTTRGCNPPANTLYRPDEGVTRAQMAAFLVRAFDLTADTHPGFSDVPSDHTFAGDIGKLATGGRSEPGNLAKHASRGRVVLLGASLRLRRRVR